MSSGMRRREVIALLASAVVAHPAAAAAQATTEIRKVGVFASNAFTSKFQEAQIAAFRQGLAALGWVEGRNLELDVRSSKDAATLESSAAALVGAAPAAILAVSSNHVQALEARTHTIPIVFVGASDPLGLHIIRSLARPGGNVTGFANYDFAMAGKWLQLLAQIAPPVRNVVVIVSPLVPSVPGFVAAIRAAAKPARITVSELPWQQADDLERATGLGSGSVTGLIVLPGASGDSQIIGTAAQRRLPALYTLQGWTAAGGLIAYVEDEVADARRAASYVDRILRGAKPGDLPVQSPTTFDLSINLKAAKALGLTVPQSLLVSANELIR